MRGLLAVALVACGARPVVKPQTPIEHEPEKPAAIVEWDKLTGPVRTVEVTGPDDTLVAKVRTALASEVGQPIDRSRLRKELAFVFESGASDVATHGVQLDDGVKLVVEVSPQPTLHALTARDAAGTALKLPSQLVAALGLPLDPGLVEAIALNLRDGYLELGFLDVTAEWKTSPAGSGKVDVVIEIAPGKAVTIDRVEFPGATHAKREELVKAIGPELAPGKPWLKDYIERAGLLVQVVYYDRGYINIQVDASPPHGEKSPLTFVIHEGPQFRVRKLAIKGVAPEQTKRYEKLIQLKSGDVFNRSVVIAAIKRIQDAAIADGNATASVTPLTEVDSDKKVIDMTFEIAK